MIIVCDTSPLNYLILIGHVDALAELFGAIIVPEAVHRELCSPSAPAEGRTWSLHPPAWMHIRQVIEPHAGPGLDEGEAEAIALALELKADLLLMDDRRGRGAAARLGLQVVGLIGVLRLAAMRGLVDPQQVVDRLQATTFRMDPDLLRRLLLGAS